MGVVLSDHANDAVNNTVLRSSGNVVNDTNMLSMLSEAIVTV